MISDHLIAVEAGRIKRLIICLPPRHGKSEMGSLRFPAWFLGRNPGKQILCVSYSADLAEGWGSEIRNLISDEEYQRVFPAITLRKDKRAAGHWRTNQGGIYNAGGVTGGIAGKGAHIAVIDDPLSEQDAYSESAREHVKRWYPGGLRSRLMPGGAVILITTRWHLDDLAGWLLREAKADPRKDQWVVLNLPAMIREKQAPLLGIDPDKLPNRQIIDVDGNEKSLREESLWPEWFDWDEMDSTRANMPPLQWNALYMQTPVEEEGGILKRAWWRDWDQFWMSTLTKGRPPECLCIIQSYDTAYSEADHTKSSYSARTTWGVFKCYEEAGVGTYRYAVILLEAWRGRLGYPDLRKKVLADYQQRKPDVVLVELKSSGQALIRDLRAAAIPVQVYMPKKYEDKVSRAHINSSILHSGLVFRPSRRWALEVVEECAAFPFGPSNDWVDTCTQVWQWLRDHWYLVHPDDPEEDREAAEEQRRQRRRRRIYA